MLPCTLDRVLASQDVWKDSGVIACPALSAVSDMQCRHMCSARMPRAIMG